MTSELGELRELSASYRDPQVEPVDHCYVVLQDCGPQEGGWGPVAIPMPWFQHPRPFVYTGDEPHVLDAIKQVCYRMTQHSGRATRLVRYTGREDVFEARPQ